jgi:hypothetical protein
MKLILKLVFIVVLVLPLITCDNDDPNVVNNDIDIKGSYTFTVDSVTQSYTHTLVFNNDSTWQFTSGSGLASQNKSGTWSIDGSILTMNATFPTSISEKFTVSHTGNSWTITLQGNSPVSNIFSLFPVLGTSLTMTKVNSSGLETTSFTVTFDSRGGSSVSTQTVKKGERATKPDDPTNSNIGYGTLNGWFTEKTGFYGRFQFDTPVTENITLYARWNLTLQTSETGPGGGIIFYRSTNGFIMQDTDETCYYLEGAPSDMTLELAWVLNNSNIKITTNDTNITLPPGYGRKNTSLILAIDSQAPAAKACTDYRGGGKSDWFLPSIVELSRLFPQTTYGDNYNSYFSLKDTRTFSAYWSSSEYDETRACFYQYSGGYIGDSNDLKTSTYGVRPIRAF